MKAWHDEKKENSFTDLSISDWRAKYRFQFKLISVILILAFLAFDVTWAEGGVPLNWHVRKDGDARLGQSEDINKFAIPLALGRVSSPSNTSGDETIVNIQDAHASLSAQYSIASILQKLMRDYDLSVVALEGTDGTINTSLIKAIPDDRTKKDTSDALLKQGKLSAGEFFAIMSEKKVGLYGAEDYSLYKANVQTFKRTIGRRIDAVTNVEHLLSALNAISEKIYSPELLEFTKNRSLHKLGKLSFPEYWKYISRLLLKNNVAMPQSKNLEQLIEVSALEGKINFYEANEERKSLINELSGKLRDEELKELVTKSVSYKKNEMGQSEFHSYLTALALRQGIPPEPFKNLVLFTEYITLFENIDILSLYTEIENVESGIIPKLIRNSDEKKIFETIDTYGLIKKLIEVNLSRNEYIKLKGSLYHINGADISQETKNLSLKLKVPLDNTWDHEVIKGAVNAAVRFYEIAEKRNKALLNNTLKAMRENKQKIGALVTGGFHSEGMSEHILGQNCSYLVITPSFLEGKERPYITILTNKKQPYEKLIEQGKYTLANEPYFSSHRKPYELYDTVFEACARYISGLPENNKKNNHALKKSLKKFKAKYMRNYRRDCEENKDIKPIVTPARLMGLLNGIQAAKVSENTVVVGWRLNDTIIHIALTNRLGNGEWELGIASSRDQENFTSLLDQARAIETPRSLSRHAVDKIIASPVSHDEVLATLNIELSKITDADIAILADQLRDKVTADNKLYTSDIIRVLKRTGKVSIFRNDWLKDQDIDAVIQVLGARILSAAAVSQPLPETPDVKTALTTINEIKEIPSVPDLHNMVKTKTPGLDRKGNVSPAVIFSMGIIGGLSFALNYFYTHAIKTGAKEIVIPTDMGLVVLGVIGVSFLLLVIYGFQAVGLNILSDDKTRVIDTLKEIENSIGTLTSNVSWWQSTKDATRRLRKHGLFSIDGLLKTYVQLASNNHYDEYKEVRRDNILKAISLINSDTDNEVVRLLNKRIQNAKLPLSEITLLKEIHGYLVSSADGIKKTVSATSLSMVIPAFAEREPGFDYGSLANLLLAGSIIIFSITLFILFHFVILRRLERSACIKAGLDPTTQNAIWIDRGRININQPAFGHLNVVLQKYLIFVNGIKIKNKKPLVWTGTSIPAHQMFTGFQKRHVFIGDWHGMPVPRLKSTLMAAGFLDNKGQVVANNTILVMLGDEHDRGPSSLRIKKYLAGLQDRVNAQAAEHGSNIVRLIGNHELLLHKGIIFDDWSLKNWLYNKALDGDVQAISLMKKMNDLSLNIRDIRDIIKTDNNYRKWRELFFAINSDLVNNRMKAAASDNDVLFVHGGISKGSIIGKKLAVGKLKTAGDVSLHLNTILNEYTKYAQKVLSAKPGVNVPISMILDEDLNELHEATWDHYGDEVTGEDIPFLQVVAHENVGQIAFMPKDGAQVINPNIDNDSGKLAYLDIEGRNITGYERAAANSDYFIAVSNMKSRIKKIKNSIEIDNLDYRGFVELIKVYEATSLSYPWSDINAQYGGTLDGIKNDVAGAIRKTLTGLNSLIKTTTPKIIAEILDKAIRNLMRVSESASISMNDAEELLMLAKAINKDFIKRKGINDESIELREGLLAQVRRNIDANLSVNVTQSVSSSPLLIDDEPVLRKIGALIVKSIKKTINFFRSNGALFTVAVGLSVFLYAYNEDGVNYLMTAPVYLSFGIALSFNAYWREVLEKVKRAFNSILNRSYNYGAEKEFIKDYMINQDSESLLVFDCPETQEIIVATRLRPGVESRIKKFMTSEKHANLKLNNSFSIRLLDSGKERMDIIALTFLNLSGIGIEKSIRWDSFQPTDRDYRGSSTFPNYITSGLIAKLDVTPYPLPTESDIDAFINRICSEEAPKTGDPEKDNAIALLMTEQARIRQIVNRTTSKLREAVYELGANSDLVVPFLMAIEAEVDKFLNKPETNRQEFKELMLEIINGIKLFEQSIEEMSRDAGGRANVANEPDPYILKRKEDMAIYDNLARSFWYYLNNRKANATTYMEETIKINGAPGIDKDAPIILFAETLTPEHVTYLTANYNIQAIVTSDSSETAHWVIAAKNRNIPVCIVDMRSGRRKLVAEVSAEIQKINAFIESNNLSQEDVMINQKMALVVSGTDRGTQIILRPELTTVEAVKELLLTETAFEMNAAKYVDENGAAFIPLGESTNTVSLYSNSDNLSEIKDAIGDHNAAGIGLMRSEYLFADTNVFEPENHEITTNRILSSYLKAFFQGTQNELHRHDSAGSTTQYSPRESLKIAMRDYFIKCAKAADDRPLTVRMFDFEPDKKTLIHRELNLHDMSVETGTEFYRTALGEDMLLLELEAIIEAYLSGATNLRILFPMVSNVDTVTYLISRNDSVLNRARTNALMSIAAERKDLSADVKKKLTHQLRDMPIGIMLETVEAVNNIGELCGLDGIDFYSIGTNDLSRYVMGEELYKSGKKDSPAPLSRDKKTDGVILSKLRLKVLEKITSIVEAINKVNTVITAANSERQKNGLPPIPIRPLSVCGEMGGWYEFQTFLAKKLVTLRVDTEVTPITLSMSSARIPEVAYFLKNIHNAHYGKIKTFLEREKDEFGEVPLYQTAGKIVTNIFNHISQLTEIRDTLEELQETYNENINEDSLNNPDDRVRTLSTLTLIVQKEGHLTKLPVGHKRVFEATKKIAETQASNESQTIAVSNDTEQDANSQLESARTVLKVVPESGLHARPASAIFKLMKTEKYKGLKVFIEQVLMPTQGGDSDHFVEKYSGIEIRNIMDAMGKGYQNDIMVFRAEGARASEFLTDLEGLTFMNDDEQKETIFTKTDELSSDTASWAGLASKIGLKRYSPFLHAPLVEELFKVGIPLSFYIFLSWIRADLPALNVFFFIAFALGFGYIFRVIHVLNDRAPPFIKGEGFISKLIKTYIAYLSIDAKKYKEIFSGAIAAEAAGYIVSIIAIATSGFHVHYDTLFNIPPLISATSQSYLTGTYTISTALGIILSGTAAASIAHLGINIYKRVFKKGKGYASIRPDINRLRKNNPHLGLLEDMLEVYSSLGYKRVDKARVRVILTRINDLLGKNESFQWYKANIEHLAGLVETNKSEEALELTRKLINDELTAQKHDIENRTAWNYTALFIKYPWFMPQNRDVMPFSWRTDSGEKRAEFPHLWRMYEQSLEMVMNALRTARSARRIHDKLHDILMPEKQLSLPGIEEIDEKKPLKISRAQLRTLRQYINDLENVKTNEKILLRLMLKTAVSCIESRRLALARPALNNALFFSEVIYEQAIKDAKFFKDVRGALVLAETAKRNTELLSLTLKIKSAINLGEPVNIRKDGKLIYRTVHFSNERELRSVTPEHAAKAIRGSVWMHEPEFMMLREAYSGVITDIEKMKHSATRNTEQEHLKKINTYLDFIIGKLLDARKLHIFMGIYKEQLFSALTKDQGISNRKHEEAVKKQAFDQSFKKILNDYRILPVSRAGRKLKAVFYRAVMTHTKENGSDPHELVSNKTAKAALDLVRIVESSDLNYLRGEKNLRAHTRAFLEYCGVKKMANMKQDEHLLLVDALRKDYGLMPEGVSILLEMLNVDGNPARAGPGNKTRHWMTALLLGAMPGAEHLGLTLAIGVSIVVVLMLLNREFRSIVMSIVRPYKNDAFSESFAKAAVHSYKEALDRIKENNNELGRALDKINAEHDRIYDLPYGWSKLPDTKKTEFINLKRKQLEAGIKLLGEPGLHKEKVYALNWFVRIALDLNESVTVREYAASEYKLLRISLGFDTEKTKTAISDLGNMVEVHITSIPADSIIGANGQFLDCLKQIDDIRQLLSKKYSIDPKNIVTTHQEVSVRAAGNDEFFKTTNSLKQLLGEHYGYANAVPPTSFVGQKPDNFGAVTVECSILIPKSGKIFYQPMSATVPVTIDGKRKTMNVNYTLVIDNNVKWLYAAGLTIENMSSDIKIQSNAAFQALRQILKDNGMTQSDIVRQWNYMERIVDTEKVGDKERQRYQIFNDVRTINYNEDKSFDITGYPAATGIGMSAGGIIIDFSACKAIDGNGLLVVPLSNPLQTDAHRYTTEVLEQGLVDDMPSTPKFERAKAVVYNGNVRVFVSGTAGIRGQATLKADDVREQTKLTLENIAVLIGRENLENHGISAGAMMSDLCMLRAYVKYEKDLLDVQDICEQMVPANVPIQYVVGDVCRSNLLVEIEGIANVKGKRLSRSMLIGIKGDEKKTREIISGMLEKFYDVELMALPDNENSEDSLRRINERAMSLGMLNCGMIDIKNIPDSAINDKVSEVIDAFQDSALQKFVNDPGVINIDKSSASILREYLETLADKFQIIKPKLTRELSIYQYKLNIAAQMNQVKPLNRPFLYKNPETMSGEYFAITVDDHASLYMLISEHINGLGKHGGKLVVRLSDKFKAEMKKREGADVYTDLIKMGIDKVTLQKFGVVMSQISPSSIDEIVSEMKALFANDNISPKNISIGDTKNYSANGHYEGLIFVKMSEHGLVSQLYQAMAQIRLNKDTFPEDLANIGSFGKVENPGTGIYYFEFTPIKAANYDDIKIEMERYEAVFSAA